MDLLVVGGVLSRIKTSFSSAAGRTSAGLGTKEAVLRGLRDKSEVLALRIWERRARGTSSSSPELSGDTATDLPFATDERGRSLNDTRGRVAGRVEGDSQDAGSGVDPAALVGGKKGDAGWREREGVDREAR
jgi:hypothetical protein